MNNEILFAERQKFKQWWIWLTLLTIDGLVLLRVVKRLTGTQSFGGRPINYPGLLLAIGSIIAVTILFICLRLDTQIKKDGIYLRFFPFHLSFRHYTWDNISKSFVRQYNPITEYGGWGLRLGLFGKGRAFTVSGNKGLQLEFFDRKKLLIGTGKPDELTETLKKIGQLKQ